MVKNWLTYSLLFLLVSCFSLSTAVAQNDKEHVEVALRMIGHQLLLNSNDSSSLVLPIENEGRRFRVRFESEFEFLPSELVGSISDVVQTTRIAKSYRVELRNKRTHETVYSYEIDSSQSGSIACGPRRQEKGPYDLFFTILDSVSFEPSVTVLNQNQPPVNEISGKSSVLILLGILVVLLFGIGFFLKSRKQRNRESNHVKIGQYRFDEKNMKLIFKSNSIDLTSKETDLLSLLLSSMNKTLERDEILKVVWGDEGDYVGRTLDVFISKLRKKFSEDANVKIVNVRGVGYKMMLI